MTEASGNAAYSFLVDRCRPGWVRSPAGTESLRELVRQNGWQTGDDVRTALGTPDDVYATWQAFLLHPTTHPLSRRTPTALHAMLAATGHGAADRRRMARVRKKIKAGVNRVYGDDDGCSPPARPLLRHILDASGRAHFGRYALRGLAQFVTDVFAQAPMTRDGPWLGTALAEAARRHHWSTTVQSGVRALVWAARCHPTNDPQGRFQTHTSVVPQAFLDRFPSLWRFPVRLARCLHGMAVGPEDTAHLVAFCATLGHDRAVRVGRRYLGRAYRSLGAQLSVLFHHTERVRQPDETYRDHLLPPRATSARLESVVARVVASHYRARTARAGPPASTTTDALPVTLGFFRVCVRAGLFGDTPPPRIDPRAVHAHMFRLEGQQPALYSAVGLPTHTSVLPGTPARRPRNLTTRDVERLRCVAEARAIPRERVILELLATTGLRAGAIQELRVDDVWDRDRQEVRPSIGVPEKNSRTRYIFPCPVLRGALRDHVRVVEPRSVLLFPGRDRPGTASSCVVRHTLSALCRAAGVAVVNPHAFRAWIVNTAMRAGGRLEDVARFMGHAQPAVTYRHYWTDAESARSMDELLRKPRGNPTRPDAVSPDHHQPPAATASEWHPPP